MIITAVILHNFIGLISDYGITKVFFKYCSQNPAGSLRVPYTSGVRATRFGVQHLAQHYGILVSELAGAAESALK